MDGEGGREGERKMNWGLAFDVLIGRGARTAAALRKPSRGRGRLDS